MTDELYVAFQNCLKLIGSGVSLNDCLARYPQYSEDLEPLLAAATGPAAGPTASMPSRVERRVRRRVFREWDHRFPSRKERKWAMPVFLPRWAMATAVIALAVFLGGAGTAAAAQDTTPGEVLYPVKQLEEAAQLWFARSPEVKVAVYTRLVRERAREITQLADSQKVDAASVALARLEQHVVDVTQLAGELTPGNLESALATELGLVESLEAALAGPGSGPALLRQTLERAPMGLYPCLQHSLGTIQEARGRVQSALAAIGKASVIQDQNLAELCPTKP